jgi:hypothetical protein
LDVRLPAELQQRLVEPLRRDIELDDAIEALSHGAVTGEGAAKGAYR